MNKDFNIEGYKFTFRCRKCGKKFGSDSKNDNAYCPLHDEKFKERMFIKKLLLKNETKGL